MKIQQLKEVAQAMKDKGFMTADEKDIWSKFISPEQVIALIERLERAEQQDQDEAA